MPEVLWIWLHCKLHILRKLLLFFKLNSWTDGHFALTHLRLKLQVIAFSYLAFLYRLCLLLCLLLCFLFLVLLFGVWCNVDIRLIIVGRKGDLLSCFWLSLEVFPLFRYHLVLLDLHGVSRVFVGRLHYLYILSFYGLFWRRRVLILCALLRIISFAQLFLARLIRINVLLYLLAHYKTSLCEIQNYNIFMNKFFFKFAQYKIDW